MGELVCRGAEAQNETSEKGLPSPQPAPPRGEREEGEKREKAEAVPRLLVVADQLRVLPLDALTTLLGPGDVLVLNDAATFPGSLHVVHAGLTLEARLFEKTPTGFRAVLFGPGDFHTRTEDRLPPPALPAGTRLDLAGLPAVISRVDPRSPRLVDLTLFADDATQWAHVYGHGAPIQYAHQPQPLPLWSVQNVYAGRPWASELPSAGHHLTHRRLARLRDRGVDVVRLTHATGLSSTGDPRLDAALPFAERYDLPRETAHAVRHATRVIAAGTSVLRALEASAESNFEELEGLATRHIGPQTALRVVDGLLTGIHAPGESHFRLLGALVDAPTLQAATELSHRAGLAPHEFGDLALLWARRRSH